MNIIKNDVLGGRPFFNEDFTFLNEAQKEVFKSLIDGLSDSAYNSIILNGGIWVVDGADGPTPVFTISEGYVFLDNEVYKIENQSINLPAGSGYDYVSDNLYFNVVQTSNTPVLYDDGTINDAYYSRTAVVSTDVSSYPLTIPTLNSIIFKESSLGSLGLVKGSTASDVMSGAPLPYVLSPENFTQYRTFTITGELGTINVISTPIARTMQIGKMITTTFQCDVEVIANAGEILLRFSEHNLIRDYIYLGPGGTTIPGFSLNLKNGQMYRGIENVNVQTKTIQNIAITAESNLQVIPRSTDTISIIRGDGEQFFVGDRFTVDYSGTYIKQ